MVYVFAALSVLHVLIVIITTLRLLLRENISSPARMAWFIVLITLPFAGLAAYLLLGEITLPDALRKRNKAVQKTIGEEHGELFSDDHAYDTIPEDRRAPFQFTSSINGFHPVTGNRIELMPDADETQRRLIADIDAAQSSVNLLFYIWLTDHTGTEIAQALMRAAKRGVTCRAAADHLGSRKLIASPLWKEMKAAGVDLQIAMPFESIFGISLITRFDLRNHRKLTIIDGKITYVGSKNAADPAFAHKAKYAPWIDIMLRLEGPIVNQVQAVFAGDWLLERDATLATFDFNGTAVEGGITAQFRATGPLERRLSVSQAFCTLFENARDELIITTPYFVPDMAVINALQAAVHRGVRVVINVPKKNDSWIVQTASRSSFGPLLEAGVEIMQHSPGLLHSKLVTVDGCITLIGSTNLDLRSFDLNFENDMLLYDTSLTAQIRARQQSYLDQSTAITLEAHQSRSVPSKLADNLIATLGPIL